MADQWDQWCDAIQNYSGIELPYRCILTKEGTPCKEKGMHVKPEEFSKLNNLLDGAQKDLDDVYANGTTVGDMKVTLLRKEESDDCKTLVLKGKADSMKGTMVACKKSEYLIIAAAKEPGNETGSRVRKGAEDIAKMLG